MLPEGDVKISDRDHPFYRPLWRRVLIVAVVAAWAAYEVIYAQEQLWMLLSLGFLAYSVWLFFFNYKPPPDDADRPGG
jgi:hypothetical protein